LYSNKGFNGIIFKISNIRIIGQFVGQSEEHAKQWCHIHWDQGSRLKLEIRAQWVVLFSSGYVMGFWFKIAIPRMLLRHECIFEAYLQHTLCM
jgi:hypothetical protein